MDLLGPFLRTESALPTFVGAYIVFHFINNVVTTWQHRTPGVPGSSDLQRRAGIYVASTLHALFVAGVSLYLLWQYGLIGPWTAPAVADAAHPLTSGAVDHAVMRKLLAVSFAYFLEDFISFMPDWERYPEDVFHHVMGLVLTGSCLWYREAAMLGHHILITELSTPFLNLMWFLRKTGRGESRAYYTAAYLFTPVFFVSRLVYLPWVTWTCIVPMWDSFFARCGVVVAAEIGLCVLNIWWFSKIVAMFRKAFSGNSGDSSRKGAGGKKSVPPPVLSSPSSTSASVTSSDAGGTPAASGGAGAVPVAAAASSGDHTGAGARGTRENAKKKA